MALGCGDFPDKASSSAGLRFRESQGLAGDVINGGHSSTSSMGARSRNATPGPPGQRRQHEEDSLSAVVEPAKTVGETPMLRRDEAHKSSPSTTSRRSSAEVKVQPCRRESCASIVPSPLHLAIAAASTLVAIYLLGDGALTLMRGVADDSRAQNIRVFRSLLSKRSGAAVPLPATFGSGQPPPLKLQAAWRPPHRTTNTTFYLDLQQVPLTEDVLGDYHDRDDEVRLPVSSEESEEAKEDLPSAVKQSYLYRAEVPANLFWAIGSRSDLVPKGRLEVKLPDGEPLLQHTFEPVKLGVDGQSEDHSKFIDRGVKRLCYALAHDESPWNGELVQDCEHGLGRPVYVPLSDSTPDEHVEIVLRASRDAYVYASETTHGCSNCIGRPFGDSRTGAQLHSCGDSTAFQPTQRCFGAPARIAQALGLLKVGAAILLLVPAVTLIAFHNKGNVIATCLVGGTILLVALEVHVGVPGSLKRLWPQLMPGYPELSLGLTVVATMLIAIAGALPFYVLAKVLSRL